MTKSFSSRSSDPADTAEQIQIQQLQHDTSHHGAQLQLQPQPQQAQSWWPSNSKRKWYTGMLVSTLFTAAYYVRPIHMAIPILMAYFEFPNRILSYLILLVLSLSIVWSPPKPSRALVVSLFGPLLDYFDYDQIVENSPVHVRETMKDGQQYIFACQPHGIVPFCGVAWSVFQAQKYEPHHNEQKRRNSNSNKSKSNNSSRKSSGNSSNEPADHTAIPTAVASLCLYTPILKHVLGIFSCVSASRASLKRTLITKSVRLYVGGTTEVFECNEHVEVLHLTKHKGFIKLALILGVDVVPVYMFGNTSVFSLLKGNGNDNSSDASRSLYGVLVRLSRVLQMPVTYFWGAYGLPIPHNDKVRITTSQSTVCENSTAY
jgi:hypothetical protein